MGCPGKNEKKDQRLAWDSKRINYILEQDQYSVPTLLSGHEWWRDLGTPSLA